MAAGRKILVVEDDSALARGIVRGLKAAGFEVELCTRGDQAVQAAVRFEPELIVLDLMLPGTSGDALLAEWKNRIATPIIVLTARAELDDRLRAFDLGAADFLGKPFWIEELVARIKTRLRLREEAPAKRIAWCGVVADLDARLVERDGEDLRFTPHELNVLAYLIERPDRAHSRDEIARSALSIDEEVGARTVDSHVARIRKKLGDEAADAIETVWGIGYRFRSGT